MSDFKSKVEEFEAKEGMNEKEIDEICKYVVEGYENNEHEELSDFSQKLVEKCNKNFGMVWNVLFVHGNAGCGFSYIHFNKQHVKFRYKDLNCWVFRAFVEME